MRLIKGRLARQSPLDFVPQPSVHGGSPETRCATRGPDSTRCPPRPGTPTRHDGALEAPPMSDTINRTLEPTARPVTGLTGTVAAVFTELCGQDGATAAALALAAEVSPSAARKALAALEQQGLARRTPGGNDRTRRLPDTWYATAPGVTDAGVIGHT